MVIGLTMLLTTIGGVMVATITNNDPILSQAAIQRYAYRALASGLNAYQSAINADPYLALVQRRHQRWGADATNQCAGISYGTWSLVPDTGNGNGVVPEYYKFDNPQQVENSSTSAITNLEVQIVGAAGYGTDVYYSTVAKFVPANGFLNNVWWTNYESAGTASQCAYYWPSVPNAEQLHPRLLRLTGPPHRAHLLQRLHLRRRQSELRGQLRGDHRRPVLPNSWIPGSTIKATTSGPSPTRPAPTPTAPRRRRPRT